MKRRVVTTYSGRRFARGKFVEKTIREATRDSSCKHPSRHFNSLQSGGINGSPMFWRLNECKGLISDRRNLASRSEMW